MTHTCTQPVETLASSLAPEDIRCGDEVAVLNESSEYASFLWDDCGASSPEDIVRIWWRPTDAGLPLKVEAVCLPFLLVTPVEGKARTIDVRSVQLVRLSPDYAAAVRRELKSDESTKSKERSRKKKRKKKGR